MTTEPDRVEFDPVRGEPDHYDADYYDGNGQAGDRPALRWYVRMVRRYVGPGPYLDFGCGTGHLLRRLGEHDRAAGFEISPYSAAMARGTAPGCVVYTALDEIPDATFRGLTAIHVLEHIDDATVTEVLACWKRVLVPGGRALVVVPDPAGRARALAGESWTGYLDPTHINLKSHAEWRAFLADAGFRLVREGSDGLWNVPYSKLPKLLDALQHAVPSLVQFLAGRLFLRPGAGESGVFVIEKSER
ncbi:class I SAM-dependent methyltransferase [Pseudonocardia nigra]|uniref:class I SAM-dependent methyltransferase n=1 Tax=Pseudonocardia nigra TaxID=1921578 RepID=UPI001C600EC7|nr:class I SAM-dependent methyltransferase [Pseudonocardia nigra]